MVTVDGRGAVSELGAVPIDPPGSAYGLGVAVAPDGAVFVAVAAASPSSTFPPGVYRIPAGGGAGSLFASHDELVIPNDVDLDGEGNLYITADGAIFRRAGASPGTAEIWLEHPLLASSDGTASAPCGVRGSPFPIGANGIAVLADRVVVGNTEAGSLIAIPIAADGGAGDPGVLVADTAYLCGIDGLASDGDGGFVATAHGSSVLAVDGDGSGIAVIHEGAPLRSPAGVDVGAFGSRRQAIVANPDFEAAFGSGGPASAEPNLTAIPL